MRRQRAWMPQNSGDKVAAGVLAALGLGFLALLYSPGPGVAVRNQMAYLRGGWQDYGGIPTGRVYGPRVAGSGKLVTLQDFEVEAKSDEDYEAFYLYCQSHAGETEAWADLARRASASCTMPTNSVIFRRSRRVDLCRIAAEQGERLDPGNAYFTLLRAATARLGGDTKGFQSLVLKASTAARFDDYSERARTRRAAWSEANFGYLGAPATVQLESSMLFPHFASMKSVAKIALAEAPYPDVPKMRVAVARLGGLMMRSSPNAIQALVGRALAAIAFHDGTARSPKQVADELRSTLSARDMPALAAKMDVISNAAMKGRAMSSSTDLEQLMNWRPRQSAAALLACVAGAISAFFVALASSRKESRERRSGWIVLPLALIAPVAVFAVVNSAPLVSASTIATVVVILPIACAIGGFLVPAADARPWAMAALVAITLAALYVNFTVRDLNHIHRLEEAYRASRTSSDAIVEAAR